MKIMFEKYSDPKTAGEQQINSFSGAYENKFIELFNEYQDKLGEFKKSMNKSGCISSPLDMEEKSVSEWKKKFKMCVEYDFEEDKTTVFGSNINDDGDAFDANNAIIMEIEQVIIQKRKEIIKMIEKYKRDVWRSNVIIICDDIIDKIKEK